MQYLYYKLIDPENCIACRQISLCCHAYKIIQVQSDPVMKGQSMELYDIYHTRDNGWLGANMTHRLNHPHVGVIGRLM